MSAHLKLSDGWKQISGIYLKVSNTWRSIASGYLKVSNTWRLFFSSSALIPTQTSAPTVPGGTGVAFTSVTIGTSGSYTNFSSKTHSLVKVLETYVVSSPSTQDINDISLSSTYTVTQNDATTPQYNFYTRDNVVGLNGTTYYFYSTPLAAYVGEINDNFNRTTSGGLGTSSSGYIYNSYANSTASWSTNGSYAINSSAVSSGTAASNHPLQTIEVGNPNKNYSVDLPDGKGGKGVSFWTTSANSWYAVASYYDYDSTTTTQTTCTGTSSCTGLNCCSSVTVGTELNQRCSACSSATITYPCGQNGATYTCSGFDCCTNNLGSLGGDYCNCTNTNSASTTQQLTCSGSSSSSSCPNTGSTVGARCGTCSSVALCTGTQTSSSCPSTGPNVGDACGVCTTNTSTTQQLTCSGSSSGSSCPGTSSLVGGRCGTCTNVVTYPCSGGTVTTSTCPSTGSLSGDRCSTCTQNGGITDGLCRTSEPVCPPCPGGTYTTGSFGCPSGSTRCRCTQPITYSYTVRTSATSYTYPVNAYQDITTTTYTYPIREQAYNYSVNAYQDITTTTYTYPIRQQAYNYSVNAFENITTYTSNYQVRGTQYSYNYSINQSETVSGYQYNTKIKLFSAVSGNVVLQSWDSPYSEGLVLSNIVAGSFDPSQWIGIYNITASTNGNTITATAYNSGGGVMGQTVGKTISSPIKANSNGETAAGVIKTYTPNNVGTSYDNFAIY